MKDSKILELFFEKQHRQWKKEAYAVFQPTRKENSSFFNTPNPTRDKEKTGEGRVKNKKFS